MDHRKLGCRLHGMSPRLDILASVLMQYILDLAAKGFFPRLSLARDMANQLPASCDKPRVASLWASNFVKLGPELRGCFWRKYNYQRAKYKDPVIICGWFEFVRHTIAKYRLQDVDVDNFDETGFMIGVISTATVVTS